MQVRRLDSKNPCVLLFLHRTPSKVVGVGYRRTVIIQVREGCEAKTYMMNEENKGTNWFCATAMCFQSSDSNLQTAPDFHVKKSDVTMAELESHIPGTVHILLLSNPIKAFRSHLRSTHTEYPFRYHEQFDLT